MREYVSMITVVMVFGIPIVAIIGYYCLSGWKLWVETALKRDMVARGFTAQEIVAVLGAGKNEETQSDLPDVPPAKPIQQPA